MTLAVLLSVALAGDGAGQAGLESAGMGVLAGWAGANVVGGTAGYLREPPGRSRAAWGAHAAWNVVNLGLAGAGLARASSARDLEAEALAERQRRLQTVLWVNAGLDVGYVAAGAGLQALGRDQQDPALQGVGDALLVQGAFLLVFDTTMALLQRRQARR